MGERAQAEAASYEVGQEGTEGCLEWWTGNQGGRTLCILSDGGGGILFPTLSFSSVCRVTSVEKHVCIWSVMGTWHTYQAAKRISSGEFSIGFHSISK